MGWTRRTPAGQRPLFHKLSTKRAVKKEGRREGRTRTSGDENQRRRPRRNKTCTYLSKFWCDVKARKEQRTKRRKAESIGKHDTAPENATNEKERRRSTTRTSGGEKQEQARRQRPARRRGERATREPAGRNARSIKEAARSGMGKEPLEIGATRP